MEMKMFNNKVELKIKVFLKCNENNSIHWQYKKYTIKCFYAKKIKCEKSLKLKKGKYKINYYCRKT